METLEIEAIIGSKKIKGKLFYRIKWKGLPTQNSTWERDEHLDHVRDMIEHYDHERNNWSAAYQTPHEFKSYKLNKPSEKLSNTQTIQQFSPAKNTRKGRPKKKNNANNLELSLDVNLIPKKKGRKPKPLFTFETQPDTKTTQFTKPSPIYGVKSSAPMILNEKQVKESVECGIQSEKSVEVDEIRKIRLLEGTKNGLQQYLLEKINGQLLVVDCLTLVKSYPEAYIEYLKAKSRDSLGSTC